MPITPELYAGSLYSLPRGQYIGNDYITDDPNVKVYTLPDNLENKDVIYLDGRWERTLDDLKLLGSEGTIALDFTAKEVNIVADANGDNGIVEMEIYIDGELINTIEIDKPQLYNVYDNEYGNHRIDLKIKGNSFSFNSFTFG